MLLQREKYKIVLLSIILLFLFIPVLQNVFRFKKNIPELKGAYTPVKDTVVSVESWFNGRYQEIKDKYLTQNFGLRTYYIMLKNQINYKLFKVANIKRVIIGKGDFLFETDYIDAYYGNNFIGTKPLTEHYKKLKAVQDYLASMGIDLEVVFLPSKASYYPELIPDELVTTKKITNYRCATILCKKLNIDYVDFSSWFLKLKDSSPYDLYPKTGIHWSNYGALISTDSLRKHIEHNTKLNLRSFAITNVYFKNSVRDPDDDIGKVMNLLSPVKTLPMPYADYKWEDEPEDVKPKTLVIADSYYWNIYTEGLANNIFSDNKYWYYNQTVYPESEPVRDVSKLDLLNEINKNKVIILMATEINVHDIGWGFVEKAYDLFKNDLNGALRKRIYVELISQNIKQNKEWLTDIDRKAKEKNISIPEMITLDAVYVYKTEYGSPEVAELLDETVARIKNTKPWMADIAKKAKEKNVSIDEMVEMDAKYIYDTELKKK
jgi:hypothetical protein